MIINARSFKEIQQGSLERKPHVTMKNLVELKNESVIKWLYLHLNISFLLLLFKIINIKTFNTNTNIIIFIYSAEIL